MPGSPPCGPVSSSRSSGPSPTRRRPQASWCASRPTPAPGCPGQPGGGAAAAPTPRLGHDERPAGPPPAPGPDAGEQRHVLTARQIAPVETQECLGGDEERELVEPATDRDAQAGAG